MFTLPTFLQSFSQTNCLLTITNCALQAHRWSRQPLPQLHLCEAPGAGDPAVHGEARDAPRPRLQRQSVRLLQGQGW